MPDDSATSFVCFRCWLKVKSFHEFYLMVEAIHNRCASEIGEDPQLNACNDKESKYLDEIMIEEVGSVQSTENAELEFDILDYGTNIEHDAHLDEPTELVHNGESSSYQETKHEPELNFNFHTDLVLDTETELKISTEHIPATKHRSLQTIKIHEITPHHGDSIPSKSVHRPNKSERQSDDIV